MGTKKEHIRFHTSVLCADDVKFLFARRNTINGDFYVVTLHRSSLNEQISTVSVEKCNGWEDMQKNSCSALPKLEAAVNLNFTCSSDEKCTQVFF
jgi:hypothetical protein